MIEDPLIFRPISEYISVKVKAMQTRNTFSNYELIKNLKRAYSNSITFNNHKRYFDFPIENNEPVVKLNKKCKEEMIFLMFTFLRNDFKEEELIEVINIYKEVKIYKDSRENENCSN